MNVRILDKLCCPICLEELALHAFVEESVKYLQHPGAMLQGEPPYSNEDDEQVIKDGVLICEQCKVWYPIYSYVPVILVFETRLHTQFARDNAGQFDRLSKYSIPNGQPEPGEKSIQETFTDEWNCVQENELSFMYSAEDLKLLHQKVFLSLISGLPCSPHTKGL